MKEMNSNSVDKANDLLYETLLSLIELNNEELSFHQKKEISLVIDNLEEVRHLLYELRNEMKTSVS